MVVRFVCVIRVSVCLVCPVCIPAPPGVFERYTEQLFTQKVERNVEIAHEIGVRTRKRELKMCV